MSPDQLPPDVVHRWCSAAEDGDATAAAACLAPDVVLVSPLTERFRFTGRDEVAEVLTAAFGVLDDIRFHTELRDGSAVALYARAHVGREELEEAQLLRLDAQGLIGELTLFVRPLPAVTGLMSALGPALARNGGRRGLAAFLGAATGPLHAMARFGERRVVPLADPGRVPAPR
ncbi:nuclear transport factor 2 family protein [Blastococcus sp. PRF04-17]|uniref:nuclear transport factor 2 family protein n=1 Tax=Blastococcus sp. PRF04-17 TaxID=2933797 RepID=UPI001FF5A9B0|nr:nuclear transport factor 2 family protein [Blastococcus sp. PRF04-17]UOY02064.1 nuclear transport factor 2 family protein [Blastococcus sp. PRF04-17]